MFKILNEISKFPFSKNIICNIYLKENNSKISHVKKCLYRSYFQSHKRKPFGQNRNNFKPNDYNNNSDITVETILSTELNNNFENVTNEEWSNARSKILENESYRRVINNTNMDAVIMGYCMSNKKFDLATKYFKYLESTHTKPNLATIGKYLRLIYTKNEEKNIFKCDKTEEEEIFRIYDGLKKDYPVLDSITLENVLLAFSLTKRWELCFDMLKAEEIFRLYDRLKKDYPVLDSITLENVLLAFSLTKRWELCFDMLKAEEIFRLYVGLKEDYPVLDSITLENVLLAFSLTKRWELCFDMLKEIKISATPSAKVYSAMAAACFLNKKENTGWDLLKELLELDRQPTSVAFLSYIETIKRLRKKESVISKLEKLFMFLQDYEIRCDEIVADQLSKFTQKHEFGSSLAYVNYKGLCKNCSQELQKFELSESEFEELKSKFFDSVILGRDLFTKTNPEELDNFKIFIKEMKKFDVVLDGLNIAYSVGLRQPPSVYVSMLANVVQHFVDQKKSVLVLGRAHMNRWPRNEWNYIKQNATVFLTQNISQDDPYLLYCALNSGKDTIVVTKDYMRGHKFLLKNPKYKTWFNRWLYQNQYQLIRIDNRKGPIFKIPPQFSFMAQKHNDVWHIPYEKPGQVAEYGDHHKHWLCLQMK